MAIATRLSPAGEREARRAQWLANLEGRRVLMERGEAGLASRAMAWREGARILEEAFWLRVDRDEARRSLRGAAFVLVCGMAAFVGLGVASGGFRNVRALFGRPLLEDSGNLMTIRYSGAVDEMAGTPPRLIPLWQERSRKFTGIAAFQHAPRAKLAWVTRNLFTLLKVQPAAGRWFAPGEADAVVLTDAGWRRHFGEARLAGQKVRIAGRWFTVVGVLPQGFWCISKSAEAFTALDLTPLPDGLPYLIGAVGRLARGATAESARQELFEIATAAGIALPRYPEMQPFGAIPARALNSYLIGLAFAVAIAAALVVRGGPLPALRGWRPMAFLAAKLLLTTFLPWALWVELSAPLSRAVDDSAVWGVAGVLLSMAFWAGGSMAIWWCFLDQRRRCPVCLQRLTLPVRVGSWSSVLDPSSTELLCDNGHGLLFTPDSEDGAPDRWTGLDSSWRDLFRK